ncbi:MAG: cytochrome P450 [Deinococcales bacterium]
MARAVLVGRPHDFGKGAAAGDRRGLNAVLGGGLLTAPSEERWRSHRRLLQPAFRRPRIEAMTPALASSTANVVEGWLLRNSADPWVDVMPDVEALVADGLQRLLFGRPLGRARAAQLRLPLALGVAPVREVRRARSEVDGVLRDEIERRTRDPVPAAVEDVLGLLLAARARGEIDDAGILDELATLLLAGIETTASAGAFALALLARAPRVQAAAADEVDHILQGRPPTAADLERLPRVTAAFDEALRLLPPIPAAPRRALRDTLLGEYVVPAGTRLLVSIHLLHRHARYWRDPAVFRPERFAAAPRKPVSGAFLPFGAGAHQCIGRELARLQGRLLLAMAMQRARFRAVEGDALGRRLAVGLTPSGGTRLSVLARGRAHSTSLP